MVDVWDFHVRNINFTVGSKLFTHLQVAESVAQCRDNCVRVIVE